MEPINLLEYEPLARERIDAAAWSYYQSGANDEITLREIGWPLSGYGCDRACWLASALAIRARRRWVCHSRCRSLWRRWPTRNSLTQRARLRWLRARAR